MKNKTRRVKEVMGPLGKKFKRPKKRELGFCDIALRSHVDYLIEPFSQPFFFDILKKAGIRSSSTLKISTDHGVSEGADSYSPGAILCCDSTSDSNVRHFNFRL